MIETRQQFTHTTRSDGRVALRSPALLHIKDGGRTSYGAHQIWYSGWIKRMSGCGPTATSNLIWYLTATRPECAALFAGDGTKRHEMQHLMEAVWKYVTPGMRGVDKITTLAEGAVRYGDGRGIPLEARMLEIPAETDKRPIAVETQAFLESAFAADLPVAFLNLSNGAVYNLDNWHWVTLVSVTQSLRAVMYDQGRRQTIDLALWLKTTTGGGGFVTLKTKNTIRNYHKMSPALV